ncbi:MAG: hypothetical protein ACP5I3_09975 [Thermoproteus sp.]
MAATKDLLYRCSSFCIKYLPAAYSNRSAPTFSLSTRTYLSFTSRRFAGPFLHMTGTIIFLPLWYSVSSNSSLPSLAEMLSLSLSLFIFIAFAKLLYFTMCGRIF